MKEKRRLVRVALELDEETFTALNLIVVMMNHLHEPAKVNRTDLIREAIRLYVQQEKKKLQAITDRLKQRQ